MKTITHNEINSLIKRVYDAKLPLFIFGASGIGKSQVVKQTARDLARNKKLKFIDWNKISDDKKRSLLKDVKGTFIFADIRGAELEPSEIKGLPSFYDGVTEWKANLLFKVLSNPQADGVLFFDELNLAMPSILASMYKIILDREVGDLSLSENIGILAGGNRLCDNANTFNLPSPLANRFLHVELRTPNKQQWIDWAFKNKIDNKIISFIEWKESYLYKFDKKTSGYTYPTPRMWAYLSKLIANQNIHIEELDTLVCSSIGDGVGAEFMAFLKIKEKLDLDKLLENPKRINEMELSEKYALLTGIAEKIYENPDDLKTYKKVMKVIPHLEEEFKIILLRYIRKNGIEGLIRIKKAKTEEEAQTYLIKNIFKDIPEWTQNLKRFASFLTF